ncbi:MAG: RNB domain-containing ribonuclease [Propionibacteriaceae bacterium]|jgi:exoribonuclease R|nr:RNB domain-containing ribonuclease [Propionibacteriaceae bacterium]
MPLPQLRGGVGPPPLIAGGYAGLLRQLEVAGDFSPQAAGEAVHLRLPPRGAYRDRTDIDFVSLDPAGAKDLDQIVHIARSRAGFRIHYAIADLPGLIPVGGAIDQESRRRGLTLYAPWQRYPLHPAPLSELVASLLADGQGRPAALWTIDLDGSGRLLRAEVERAWVRNRAQLSYAQATADMEADRLPEPIRLLPEVGLLRQGQEIARGGVSLNLPAQEIQPAPDGGWRLVFRRPSPVEGWNAQISLLAGAAAADLMLRGGCGVLRTLPPASPQDLERLRRVAQGLRLDWPAGVGYPKFVRSLDPGRVDHLAMLNACASLFRGAGYALVSRLGTPTLARHAALALPYAHVTAPLRRLVDRFATEVCLSLCAGQPIPDWVERALPDLPQTMAAAETRSHRFHRGLVDLVESLVLADRVGEVFPASVVARRGRRATVQLEDPAVEVNLDLPAVEPGREIMVRLLSVKTDPPQLLFDFIGHPYL